MTTMLIVRRDAPSVVEQPAATMERWRLLEHRSPEAGVHRHVAGITAETGKMRMTTPVREWDLANLRAVTSSGRSYALAPVPEAGHDDEAFVLQVGLVAAAHGCTDVTDAVLARDGHWATHDA